MANNNATYQQVHTVSIPREKLVEISVNPNLGKKDLRVLIILLTQLDGYKYTSRVKNKPDPLNFKRIDVESIADTLNLTKKEVRRSIELLELEGYLEDGDNETIKNGYRFTF